MYDFKDVVRVCQTSTIAGLKAINESKGSKLLRFIYMSGSAAERDQTKTPRMMGQYLLMRVSGTFVAHGRISRNYV